MNPQEINEFLHEASATFASVMQAIVKPEDPTSPQFAAWKIRIKAWQKTLSGVTLDDARRCLTAMHNGDAKHDLKFPTEWSDRFPAFVRRWCRENKAPTLSFANRFDGREPRYECIDCLDRGYVLTVSPAYVRQFRQVHVDRPEAIDPMDRDRMAELREWYRTARKWCRDNGHRHFSAAVVCACECPVAITQRSQRHDQHKDVALFNPKTMPVVDAAGPVSAWQAIASFVSEHEAEEAYEWTP